jgi:peroxiredoxin
MGFLVDKSAVGFGLRSWRYAMIVNDKNIEVIFEEPGYGDEASDDPYEVTDPNTVLNYLKEGLLPQSE